MAQARKGLFNLFSYGLYLFFMSGISVECEQVFNSTKRVIINKRNRIVDDTIEVSEY